MNAPTKLTTMPSEKLPLSAVFIAMNAASELPEALQSVQFCEDILIVDSGSTDDTPTVARQHGARVLHKDWLGFGPQKRWAVEQARHDWVLCLDADERVSPDLEQSIRQAFQAQCIALENDPLLAGFEFPRSNFFLGKYLRHGEGYPDYSRRLFHRMRAQWSLDEVHEKVEARLPEAGFQRMNGDLLHHSAESLQTYLNKQNRYTSIQARHLVERRQIPGWGKVVLSPLTRFIKFYLIRRGFLDGLPGLVHIAIGCFNSFVKYAKAIEISKSEQADKATTPRGGDPS